MTFNIEEIGELKILTCTTDDGSIFQLGSRYHKDKYQKIWAQNYTSSYSHAVYFVFGFGDGSYIRALLEAADENAHIIIYEPNSELIPFVTEHFDVSDILGDKHILLLAPDAVNNLAQQLAGKISLLDFSGIQICKLPNYHHLFKEEYDYFANALSTAAQLTLASSNSAKNMSETIVENILANFAKLSGSYSIEELTSVITPDMPVIIVGAGPSLNASLEYIRANRDKAVILAVDTAVPSLLKHDITPHFFISVDPIKEEFCFEDPRVADIPAIVPIVCRKVICEKRNAPTFFYASSVRFCDLLEYYYKISLPVLDAESSVANHAFAACIFLQTKNVYLIGVDLAFLNGKTHAVGSSKENDTNNTTSTEIEGVNGEILYTDPQMHLYRELLEERIRLHPEMEVTNLSQTGAKIHGTKHSTIREMYETQKHTAINLDFSNIKPFTFDKKVIMSDLINKQTDFNNKLHAVLSKVKNNASFLNDKEALPIIELCDNLVSFILGTAFMELIHIKSLGNTMPLLMKLRENCDASLRISRYADYLSEIQKTCNEIIQKEKELLE